MRRNLYQNISIFGILARWECSVGESIQDSGKRPEVVELAQESQNCVLKSLTNWQSPFHLQLPSSINPLDKAVLSSFLACFTFLSAESASDLKSTKAWEKGWEGELKLPLWEACRNQIEAESINPSRAFVAFSFLFYLQCG